MDVSREVVVVTGASAGVGRATAELFGKHGAKVALLARGSERLEAAAKEVKAAGGIALAVPTDVADAGLVEAAAAKVEETFGPIDVWINDAMVTVFSPFKEITPEEFLRATSVTYLGAVYGTMAALKRMLPRDRGTIVQVGSALSYRAIPLQAPYCASKFAMRGFTDSLRTELRHDKSRVWVTMVQLPALNTPQFDWCRTKLPNHPMPVPPIYQPEVAAEGIYFAAHQRRREVWVGGTTVGTILGNKVAAGLLDRYLAKTGYGGQQVKGQPGEPGRPDNLFEPVEGDFGSHGSFDRKAHPRSLQLWLTRHRPWLLAVAAAAGVAGTAALGLRARD
jgi:NAD(P)-dependent dehydrogenase (short-subunit alcohol dehydrogenase family)